MREKYQKKRQRQPPAATRISVLLNVQLRDRRHTSGALLQYGESRNGVTVMSKASSLPPSPSRLPPARLSTPGHHRAGGSRRLHR